MQLEDGTVVRLTQERANQLLMASIGAAALEDQNYHRCIQFGYLMGVRAGREG